MAVKFESKKKAPVKARAAVKSPAAAKAVAASKTALAPAVVSVRFPVEVLEFIDAQVAATGADRAKVVRDIVGRAASRSAKRAAA